MKSIICGAGDVGYSIADKLSKESFDVTVLDESQERLKKISENLDVKTIILNQNLNNDDRFEIENLPLDMGDYQNINKGENNYELSLKEARNNFEKDYLLSQIKRFNGNIKKISEFTGME